MKYWYLFIQACSGRLLKTVSRHFQPITIIKWSPDGSYLVTGNYLHYAI